MGAGMVAWDASCTRPFKTAKRILELAGSQGNLEGTDLGWTARYISRMESSSLVMLACCATMSFTCEIMVPNSEAAKRKRTLQNI